ncbi:MAG: hypothetical protein ACRCYP_05210 [Alphaproteobacteria bacterium]
MTEFNENQDTDGNKLDRHENQRVYFWARALLAFLSGFAFYGMVTFASIAPRLDDPGFKNSIEYRTHWVAFLGGGVFGCSSLLFLLCLPFSVSGFKPKN